MMKQEFINEAMKLKVMKMIQEYYNTPDESETLAIYNEIDAEFEKVFKERKYKLVHGEVIQGYLHLDEYRLNRDYWIGEHVLGNIGVAVRINFKDLEDFEIWKKESNID